MSERKYGLTITFDDSDYYHVTCQLTDKIMPKGCHAEITDIFMDSHLL